jgi:hypothetical protein
MPDWARTILQQTLTGKERARVRRVILEAIGLGGRRAGRDDETLQIGLTDQRKLTADRVKADHIMIDYLLPALRRYRRLFALPAAWANRLARRRLWHMAGVAIAAVIMAACTSFVGLSLLPIDECDLLAASIIDPFRIGSGLIVDLLESQPIYRDRALAACRRTSTNSRANSSADSSRPAMYGVK